MSDVTEVSKVVDQLNDLQTGGTQFGSLPPDPVDQLNDLQIGGTQFGWLPPDPVDQVNDLQIGGTQFRSLPPDPVDQVNDLQIGGTQFGSLPPDPVDQVNDLQIGGTQFGSLPPDPVDQVNDLQIGGTQFRSLPPDPVDQVNDLQIGGTQFGSLPPDPVDLILASLHWVEVFKVQRVCKTWWKARKRGSFRQGRARLGFVTECSLSPLVFYANQDCWYFWGYDAQTGTWRTVPPFKHPIPGPDPDLFKDFHVAAHRGLFCVNVGKVEEELYVCNPLTGETYRLPPLSFPRQPVVLHVHVTSAKKTEEIVTSRYWVIVVGSAAIGTESLSRKTEVYDSLKREWEVAGDVPGEDFCLNDYQTGVYYEKLKLLLCVGFMVNGMKGILFFDVRTRKWLDRLCPFLVDGEVTVYFAIAHLVLCGGNVYLFSEQEAGRDVKHCIDRLDLDSSGGHAWTRVKTIPRQGNRALLVYPEYTCVPVGENKLCIFNTIEKTGVVYDMLSEQVAALESLPPPPSESGVMFHSLNPVGYAFEPSFLASPFPNEDVDVLPRKDKNKEDVENEDVGALPKNDNKGDVENEDLAIKMSRVRI